MYLCVWLNSKVQSTAVSFLFIKTGIGLQTATKNNIKGNEPLYFILSAILAFCSRNSKYSYINLKILYNINADNERILTERTDESGKKQSKN